MADTNKYLDGVFPGTNPWERLGVNAGSPLEVAQENQRTQRQQQEAALRTQMAFQASQFEMQRKLQEAQLSTQKQLKQMEIAGAKDVATTTARANIINQVGVQTPGNVGAAHEFLTTGRAPAAYANRPGLQALKEEEINIRDAQLFNDIERVKLEARKVSVSERQQFLKEKIDPILAEAARITSLKSGNLRGTIGTGIVKGYDALKELAPKVKGVPEYVEDYIKKNIPKR